MTESKNQVSEEHNSRREFAKTKFPKLYDLLTRVEKENPAFLTSSVDEIIEEMHERNVREYRLVAWCAAFPNFVELLKKLRRCEIREAYSLRKKLLKDPTFVKALQRGQKDEDTEYELDELCRQCKQLTDENGIPFAMLILPERNIYKEAEEAQKAVSIN